MSKQDIELDPTKPMYLCLVRGSTTGELCVTTDEFGNILANTTAEEAKRPWEEMYKRNLKSTYEAAMSACIHSIQFGPKIVRVDSIEDARVRIVGEPPY